eukprot:GFYU01001876.1.p1 GENE.GFYU01001876.1~~GFYU01001876.1.p1  ORF type:complete len:820 (-),score=207.21 GFYU01001876.1:43-2502(-)
MTSSSLGAYKVFKDNLGDFHVLMKTIFLDFFGSVILTFARFDFEGSDFADEFKLTFGNPEKYDRHVGHSICDLFLLSLVRVGLLSFIAFFKHRGVQKYDQLVDREDIFSLVTIDYFEYALIVTPLMCGLLIITKLVFVSTASVDAFVLCLCIATLALCIFEFLSAMYWLEACQRERRKHFSLNADGGDGVEVTSLVKSPRDKERKDSKSKPESAAERAKKLSKKEKRGEMMRIIRLSRPDLHIVCLGFLGLTCASLCELAIPTFTSGVITAVTIDGDRDAFRTKTITLVILGCASGLFTGLRGGSFSTTNNRVVNRLRTHLFTSLLQQDVSFFDQQGTGELTSRLTSDTTAVANVVGLNANVMFRQLIMLIGGLVYLFVLSWKLTIVNISGFIVMTFISRSYGNFVKDLTKKVQDQVAEGNKVAEQALSLIRVVKSFSTEDWEDRRYGDTVASAVSLLDKQSVAYGLYTVISMNMNYGIIACVLYYGGTQVFNGEMSPQDMTTYVFYAQFVSNASFAIADMFTSIMQSLGASSKVFELMDRPNPMEIKKGEDATHPMDFQGGIEFKDITFAYPTRPETNVLNGFSLNIPAGSCVALVGKSGGGKSTTLSLLTRFYDPASGSILIDGINLKDYDPNWIHNKIAVVTQEPQLFGVSVKENIAYGMTEDEYDFADVVECARLSNAHQFVSGLTDGYDTNVGEKGVQLSGGQKQRIAIARALMRKPQILLLDEATSALDAESEHLVQDALDKAMVGRTVIIIAHRLSTVQNADCICVINDGGIVEMGTHQELVDKDGVYKQLVLRQMQDPNSSVEHLMEYGDK